MDIKLDINIKPLTPDLLDDFLYYFDNIAFSDNPDWSGCYCYFHHYESGLKAWSARTKEENRSSSKQLILSGKLNGFLVYKKDKPIGWLNIDLTENYVKLPIEEAKGYPQEGKVASIVCFIIAPAQRRQGIARQLLRYACSSLKIKEYDIIEAYPKKGLFPDAHSYHGPDSLYFSEGFSIFKELTDSYIVRKKL